MRIVTKLSRSLRSGHEPDSTWEHDLMPSYDEIRPIKRWHYFFSWLFASAIFLTLQEIVFAWTGDRDLPLARLFITLLVITGLPVAITYFQHSFDMVERDLSKVLKNSTKTISDGAYENVKQIFSLKNQGLVLWAILLYAFVIYITLTIQLPFNVGTVSAIIVLLSPICFVGAHAFFVVYQLIRLLVRVAGSEINPTFYTPAKFAITGLQSYYNRLALVALLIYSGHYYFFILAGYSREIQIAAWMLVTGFLPVSLYVFTFLQIRKLLIRIKQHYLELIGVEISQSFLRYQKNPTTDTVETLKGTMDIQAQIMEINEWPVEFSGLFTLLLTLAPPVVQVIIAVVSTIEV